jgi:hypothetical protein
MIAADRMTGEEKEHLKVAYNTARGFDYENHEPDAEPEDLPAPAVSEPKKSDLLKAGR